ncbi:DUF1501 domain-containing protein [Pseudorhodoferax sp.]|uniref:DUF1501 domain-containing protein n=1 Tax=Pseudorhodoferax sp. TaxID=1993553 RepID=UPI002DD62E0C|nr:DUF1501 domain-containing protein [Pseudorhodoferax sp.]
MTLPRRQLLALASTLPLALCAKPSHAQRPAPRWIVVLLRGAVDGLSVCAPYEERAYREERPNIALPAPGQEGGLLALEGAGPRFGLHPALAPLLPLWRGGQFGLLHASGLPGQGRRSHFEAQDELEAGTPGRSSTADGWLARLLRQQGDGGTAVRALYSAAVRPKLLAGFDGSTVLPGATRGGLREAAPAMAGALDRLYAQDSRYAETWRSGQMGRQQVAQALQAGADASSDRRMEGASGDAPDRGAPAAGSLPDTARRLAQALRADARLQFAVLELGGWDTHARQGAAQGQLANRLAPLAVGLAQLAQALGPVWDDCVVTVLSEFGRTVRENGNAGTDHGHGNAAWLLGGRVAGGRVLGDWPTLDAAARHQGRDLAITTDLRALLAGVAARHLGLRDAALDAIFPGYAGGLLAPLRA